jgi:integrase
LAALGKTAGLPSATTRIGVLIDEHIAGLTGMAARTVDTYTGDAGTLKKHIGGVTVGEVTAGVCNTAIQKIRGKHGAVTARRCRTILKAALNIAVLGGVIETNPVRDINPIAATGPVTGAPSITVDALRDLLVAVQASEVCAKKDLADPITLFIATGLRRSELLGLRWRDYNPKAGTITVSGKVVRVRGKGLIRTDQAKTNAGLREIQLPKFAINCLNTRKKDRWLGAHPMVFPSTVGTWRDPDNFAGQWRQVRDGLDAADITTHSFRKGVATLIDGAGLSARVGADQLGHEDPSMTMTRYWGRGGLHQAVADALDAAIGGE